MNYYLTVFGGDGEFRNNVRFCQVVLVIRDNLLAVLIIHCRILGAVEDVDFVTGHVGCRVDGSVLGMLIRPSYERGDTGQEWGTHAVESIAQ